MNDNQTNNNLTRRDIFFAVAISIFVGLGIQQIYANQNPKNANISLAPSFLLGAATSLISQMWLGGIDSKNRLDIKNKLMLIKIGGGAAVLLASTFIFQSLIQMYAAKSLIFKPSKDNLTVFDDQAKPQSLTIMNPLTHQTDLISPDQNNLKIILNQCRAGRGFCSFPTHDVSISISHNLKTGNAIVCNDDLDGLNLALFNSSKNNGIQVTGYNAQTMEGTAPSIYCSNNSKTRKWTIWISAEDSKKLTKYKVTVGIVPQKQPYPTSGIYKK